MRVDPLAPIHAEIMQCMGWEPGVYKGRWLDTPQAGAYEAAGWKKGSLLRRICPMYGHDAQTIPELAMFLWDIGFALQMRYAGEWVYVSVHKVAKFGEDDVTVMGDPAFEAASEITNCSAAVCSVFMDAVRKHEVSEAKRKEINRRKAAKQRAKKNGQAKKDQK